MGKVFTVIPARAGSKSIHDKNIQEIGGRSLIVWSIAAALAVKEIDRIIVSTDSANYARLACHYFQDVEVVYRPDNISQDTSTDLEWVQHLLTTIGEVPEYLIHLRPTSPLRDPEYISCALTVIRAHHEATALRSVCEMSQSVHKHFYIEEGYLKSIGLDSFELDLANNPRHMYPSSYDANGYVDILKTSHILEHNQVHGNRVIPFHVPHITDIDGIVDLEYARFEYQKNPGKYNKLFGEENV